MTDVFVEIMGRKIIHRQKTTNGRLDSFFSVNLLSVMIFCSVDYVVLSQSFSCSMGVNLQVNVSKIDDDGWETKYWPCLHYINVGEGMNPCGD